MKFEELLKKYEDGTATPEERQLVADEIEKVRLIEEHLALQEEEMPFVAEPETAQAEIKSVRRQVKRNTRGTALAVAAAVLAVFALLQWVVFPLVNARIYDHGEEYTAEGGQLSEYKMFMDVYTQLHMPLYNYVGTYKESTGFGRWTLYNQFWNVQGQCEQAAFTLRCGLLLTKSQEFWSLFPAVNLFEPSGDEGVTEEGWAQMRATYDAALEKMDDSVQVTAAVSFTRPLTMAELVDFRETWGQENGLRQSHMMSAALHSFYGVRPMFLRLDSGAINWGEGVSADYPCLSLTGLTQEEQALPKEELYQQHLESQLRYMIDHPHLSRRIAGDTRPFQHMLAEVQENGAQFSGFWYQGTAQELLGLYESGVVAYIWPQEAHIALAV